jgi:monoamine oxidase
MALARGWVAIATRARRLTRTMLDVVIVGAGAAGIAAARRCSELRLDYRLLEAKPFPGGRALTDNATFGVPVDLGCHWFHSPASNPLKPLADVLGVRYVSRPYSTRYASAGRWLDADEARDCEREVEACFARVEAMGRAGRDCAVSEVGVEGVWGAAFFEAEFAAKQGVAPRCGSTLDYAEYVWEGDDLPVSGGLGNLIVALGADTRIECDTAATHVDAAHADRVHVTTTRGVLDARTVLLTVSTGVLAHALRFTPGLPEWKRAAIERLPMGSCNKVVLGFERGAFGELRDCIVLPGRAGESVELLVRPDGAELVVCMLNGEFGRDLAAAGTRAMSEHALDCLYELFGSSLRRAVRPSRLVADWDHDPYARGYVSAALPGDASARRELARDVDSRIFFAGEATHACFMGDVHGAWLSGIDAVEAIARALRAARA